MSDFMVKRGLLLDDQAPAKFVDASGVLYVSLKAPSQVSSGNVFITLPANQPISGTILIANASGELCWCPILKSGDVTSGFIGNASVVSGSIASGQIGSIHLASGTIPAGFALSSGIITSGYIGDAAVVSGSIGSGQIGRNHVSSGVLVPTYISGTANQILGINAGATANEYKTLAAAGNISITNNPNLVTIGTTGDVPLGYYISAYSDATQSNTGLASGNLMTYNVVSEANGISVRSGSNIVFGYPGTYNIQFSAQLDKTDSGTDQIDIWLKRNGANVADSSTRLDLTGNNAKVVAAWNWVLSVSSGDYTEIAWYSADADLRLFAEALISGHIHPAIPSVILTAVQVMNTTAYGTVTNVDLSLPNQFVVSGNPVVSSGILSAAWAYQPQNTFLAAPANTSGTPSFRVISSGDLISGQVMSGSISSGQIGVNHLISGLITTLALGSGQVNSGNIASGAVFNNNIASGGVLSGKLGNSSVNSGNISSGSVGLVHLASGTVFSGTFLLSGNVTSGYIGNSSVNSGNITSGVIGNIHIASGGLTSGAISSGSIGSVHLADGAVQSGDISSGQIGGMHLSSGAVNSGHLAANSVVSGDIASGTITGGSSGQVQVNNGAALTGSSSLTWDGTILSANQLTLTNSVGDEGGEILLAKAQTNTTLSGTGVTIDVYQDRLRFFEQGGNARGFYLQITSGGGGVSTNIMADGAVVLQSGQVQSGFIGNAAVVSGNIASGQVSFNHLSSGAATGNLLSGSVSNNQLANSAITINGASTALGGSYSNAALTIGTGLTGGSYNGSGAVTVALASGAALTNLLSGNIGSGLLANNSVVSGSIASGQIGVNHLISGLITTLSLGSGQVTSGNIASGVVFRLLSGNITSGFIGDAAVVSGNIASGQIFTLHIASGGLLSGAIGSGQIGQFHLASGVGGSSLTSGSVTSGYIGNAAIVSGSVGSGQIGTIHFSSGSVAKFTSSSSAPSNPSEGDRWYYTDDGVLLTYVNDGSSSQWVQF